jgi:hypothetical protein
MVDGDEAIMHYPNTNLPTDVQHGLIREYALALN